MGLPRRHLRAAVPMLRVILLQRRNDSGYPGGLGRGAEAGCGCGPSSSPREPGGADGACGAMYHAIARNTARSGESTWPRSRAKEEAAAIFTDRSTLNPECVHSSYTDSVTSQRAQVGYGSHGTKGSQAARNRHHGETEANDGLI